MVARNLLDTLRAIFTNHEDLEEGLKVLVCLSEDIEPMVRSELMEQIPHLAMFCSENRDFFPNTIHDTILPTVVRYLTDGSKNKSGCSSGVVRAGVNRPRDMIDQVVPVIIQLSSQESSDDYRTEAVALTASSSPQSLDVTREVIIL
ncbi:putative serine/threonine-protein phosphatase 4 regulatory subunit 1 [Apostichopus japonicus]|uniref:Putative serine/threonine-protein phosphatase 4 regulatory subunit 1 n=1 Tax=Stichopus japonicus TaxID=307972 RepID=A0A2G8LSC4_STIJA|nr:putative serine/threonine-protein phosphatase 4 regulatory subunit 1 [Apostichopus japonicus]